LIGEAVVCRFQAARLALPLTREGDNHVLIFFCLGRFLPWPAVRTFHSDGFYVNSEGATRVVLPLSGQLGLRKVWGRNDHMQMNLAGLVILGHPQILETIAPILAAYLLDEMRNVFTST